MVPVPLKPANFKANSVLSCVFPSSSQQLQDLKIWAMPTVVEIQTAIKSFIQGEPVESQALQPVIDPDMQLLETETARSQSSSQ